MPEFRFQEMFPHGEDTTPYRRVQGDFVAQDTFRGESILTVDAAGLTRIAAEAVRDVSHLFRPGHLAQLRKVVDDPEASDNDRFVALAMLRNANVSAGMVLPSCQDTGTAIVLGKKGQRVWVDGNEEEAARRLGIGRDTVYGLIRDGAIRSHKVGRRRLVSAAAVAAYASDDQERGS